MLARLNDDARQDFTYDDSDRLMSIQRTPTDGGRKIGVTAERLEFAYDILVRLTQETSPQRALTYDYDPLSNLTTLTLPTGMQRHQSREPPCMTYNLKQAKQFTRRKDDDFYTCKSR